MSLPTRIVVVGNGMAGARLVTELRARNANTQITVFESEGRLPYNRTLLSAVLAGTARFEQLRLVEPAWYRDHGVTVHRSITVTAIDRRRRQVISPVPPHVTPYDRLVLATGSEPIIPPIPGVHLAKGFRTLGDCQDILTVARASRRAVVIGGGMLGIEAARGLAGLGLRVTVAHLADYLMEQQLDAEAAAILLGTLRDLGVRVRLGATVTRVTRDGAWVGPDLLPADLVVAACGVRPMTGLARAAGLVVDRGIVVDDELRTSDPVIHAIGECAQHGASVYGLLAPCWEQADVVAALLTGTPAAYQGSRRVLRLKAASIELASLGDGMREEGVELVRFSHPAGGTYRKLVIRENRLVGAILLGETSAVGTLTQLYDRGADLPARREELLFPRMRHGRDDVGDLPETAVVCSCNHVTKASIKEAWQHGAADVTAVAAATRATTGCGSCADTVDRLLRQASAQAP
ncbi:FAD-dependent oxidoreductase [Nonomuraea typhae]|uniref:FAD-dependent oxidoreductase n=1 Tax=Nonomuraea typhae TaxID=2603600 RepID=UPI0012FA150E|nr:FAD-dependent oxidoreductase [Nonomuraea typhae]